MRRNNVALDTVSKIDAYFKSTAELLASIADKGVVKRPAFTVDMALSYTPTEIRPLAGEMLERDVGVGIGPQGELLRVCSGLHRTAAALHLGVTSMPVELRMIHIDILRQNGAADDPLAAIRRTLDYARSAFAPENQSGVAPHRNQQPSIHQETPSS